MAYLSCGDDLREGIVENGLVGDKVEEVNSVLVQSKNMLASLARVTVASDGKEAGAKELPLGEDLQHLGLRLAGAHVLHLCPAALHHVHPLRWFDVPR